MKKKIFTLIFFVFFLLIFSFWNSFEYLKFHQNNDELTKENLITEKKLENFSLENIKKLEKTDIFYTPDEKVLENIVENINNSSKKIYIEVYMFTEKRIREALKKAKNRWVEIKIIMEKNPYMANSINNKSFDFFKKNNINVKYSETKNYFLNHTKILIIDDLSIISSWNLTYSTFTKNRDFFIFSKDKTIKKSLENIFLDSFSAKKIWFYNENLLLSPFYSREKIEKLFLEANKEIKIYMQYLKDEKINKLLIKLKKEKNIDIQIILDKTAENDENNIDLIKNWIKIKKYNWPKMHSKAILVDNKYLYIWSINFSEYSLDKNKEIWILLKNEYILQKFFKIFKKDYNSANILKIK